MNEQPIHDLELQAAADFLCSNYMEFHYLESRHLMNVLDAMKEFAKLERNNALDLASEICQVEVDQLAILELKHP